MIVGTAGHIDHGKTALVRALTGVDTDRLAEERRRGITIELGFAPLALDDVGQVGVVDVPGHEAFVRTMVAGATGIDVGLLVVAADEGIMPQTREHAAVLDLLGVEHAVVAITKCDLAGATVREARAREAAVLLAPTAMAGAACIAVSAHSGEGLDALRRALAHACGTVRAKRTDDLARLPVDRVFSKAGAGTVVTGTLWSGTIGAGDEMSVMPGAERARVRAVHVHGASVARAVAGSRVAVALAGLDRSAVGRGNVLVSANEWRATTAVRADVRLLPGSARLTSRSHVRMHVATTEVGARVVAAAGAVVDAETHAVRIVFDAPVVVRGGDRFVLRRSVGARGMGTVGGGVITDACPPRTRARAFPAAGLTIASRIAAIAREAGTAGVPHAALAVRLGLAPREIDGAIDAVGDVVRVGTVIVERDVLERTGAAVCAWLDDFHAQHRTTPGAAIDVIRTALGVPPHTLDEVVRSLVADGRLVRDSATVRRAGWRAAGADAAGALKSRLHEVLTECGAAVPTVAEIERALGAQVVPALRALEREQLVTALTRDRYVAVSVADALWENLKRRVSSTRVYTPSELRPIMGLSRQYVMAWLEYLDRKGHSIRLPEGRRFRV